MRCVVGTGLRQHRRAGREEKLGDAVRGDGLRARHRPLWALCRAASDRFVIARPHEPVAATTSTSASKVVSIARGERSGVRREHEAGREQFERVAQLAVVAGNERIGRRNRGVRHAGRTLRRARTSCVRDRCPERIATTAAQPTACDRAAPGRCARDVLEHLRIADAAPCAVRAAARDEPAIGMLLRAARASRSVRRFGYAPGCAVDSMYQTSAPRGERVRAPNRSARRDNARTFHCRHWIASAANSPDCLPSCRLSSVAKHADSE